MSLLTTPPPALPRPTVATAALLVVSLGIGGCAWLPGSARTVPRDDARAQAFLADAEAMLDQGLTDEALDSFALAIQENPRLTDAYLGAASIHKDRGDYTQAERAFEAIAAYDPANFDAAYGSALMKQLTGRLREAIRGYLRALTLQPDSFEANRDVASAYLQAGEPASALTYAQRATQFNPDSQAAWSNLAVTFSMLGRWDDAVAAYRTAAELGDLDDPVLLGLAEAHIRLSNFGRAINVLETLVANTPSPPAWERLGFARFKLRQFENALKAYDNALGLAPDDVASLNGKGVCHMTLWLESRYEAPYHKQQALTAWRRSLEINRDQPRIVDLLSRYGRK